MSPQTAYVMTSLLQGGVRTGTGARMSQYLKRRDLAGKTGTTNNSEDAWFIGFNPDFTTGVWVGFDEKRPVGRREEGGRAALPIWGYYMKGILENKAQRDFPTPPDITLRDMLTFTGNPSDGYIPKVVKEPVYTPFAGHTLVLSPVDSPETLAAYRGIAFPDAYMPQTAHMYPRINPYQFLERPGTVLMEPQGATVPLHPMDGRNLFPDERRLPANPDGFSGRPPQQDWNRQPQGTPYPRQESLLNRSVPAGSPTGSRPTQDRVLPPSPAMEQPQVPRLPGNPNPHYAPFPNN
jgi:penicillin-binding protein 1A